MKARARAIRSLVSGRARAMPFGLRVTAAPTELSGVTKYLRVQPETPQQLVWLVPQYGIDYQVESNTNWNII